MFDGGWYHRDESTPADVGTINGYGLRSGNLLFEEVSREVEHNPMKTRQSVKKSWLRHTGPPIHMLKINATYIIVDAARIRTKTSVAATVEPQILYQRTPLLDLGNHGNPSQGS